MRRLLPHVAAVLLLVSTVPTFAEPPPYTSEQLSLTRYTAECQISPDGETVAFVSDITGALELWTVDVASGWPNQLTNLNEQVSDIRWSPDGQWLVFASDYGGNERRDLYRVPANGGAVEKLTETKLSESAPRFSPDGKRITFTADPDQEFLFQLHVLDLETRKTVQLTHEPVNVLAPVWSLDGRTIAITRSGDDQKGELLLVNASTGAKVVIEPPVQDGILWPETFSPDGQKLLLTARNEAGFYQLAVLELADAARRFENWYETEMGNPKADAALFRERSPLLYLDDIKVPLLIFQGTNDSNVPKSESDLLVAVLEALKKPYEYVVYEDEGHGFTKRKNLLDHYRRTVEFFTKHLKPKE